MRIAEARWQQCFEDYVTGQGALRALAEKHGLPRQAVETRSVREGWVAAREARERSLRNRLINGMDSPASRPAGPPALSAGAVESLSGKLAAQLERLPELAAKIREFIQTAPDAKSALDGVRAFALLVEIWRGALPQPGDTRAQSDYGRSAEVIGLAPLEGEVQPVDEPEAETVDPVPAKPCASAVLPAPPVRPAVGVIVRREPVAAHA